MHEGREGSLKIWDKHTMETALNFGEFGPKVTF